MKVSSIQPTPNPNAFKFLVDQALAKPGQTLAYAKPEQARNDVLAQGMFAIPGVETLFFCDNFVTVSMTAQADWRGVAEQVTRLLESHIPDENAPSPVPDHGHDHHHGHDHDDDNPLAKLPKGGDPEVLGRINALLDDRVRPALAGDGGGLQVMGLEGKTLFIRYQGACGSCPSSTSGTLMAIQNLLQSEIDEELVVTMS
ncbi:MAG: NifU family protein [Planctomycetes bacterium]|nr:NifU family protein [Planctomycetota bacterium]